MKLGSHTERIQQALTRIAAGETPYRVAKDTKISLSYLYRLLAASRRQAQA